MDDKDDVTPMDVTKNEDVDAQSNVDTKDVALENTGDGNDEPEKPTYRNSLFTVHDGTPEKMTIPQLFDADAYDTFEGVTYSASGNFINRYLTQFKTIRLITGAGDSAMNSKVYNAMQAPTQNIHRMLLRNLRHDSASLYQELTDYTKEMFVKHDFDLRVPLQAVIHSKFYLLSNSQTGKTRFIIGSANLSNQAFNDHVQQFETILVFDDQPYYDVFKQYFDEELYPTTTTYFSKSYLKAAKKDLGQKPKTLPTENVVDYTITTPDQLRELEAKEFKEHYDELQKPNENTSIVLVTPQLLGDLREDVDNNASTLKDEAKAQVDDDKVVFELMRDSVSLRGKQPKFKTPQSLTNVYKKHVHIKEVENVNNEVAERKARLIAEPSMRTKTKTGLLLDQADHRPIPFGKKASIDDIRRNLDGIQHLIENYLRFAVNADDEYCSRMMEAILYAFEAPFLWEVRQKASAEIEGQDIPQFLFIGGVASSGKSSLVKVLMKLLGLYNTNEPLLYDNVLPDNVNRKKALTVAQLKAWTMSENVAPLFVDEIPDDFFTNPKYGEEMVVQVANATAQRQSKFPVFISTTNSSDYSFNERAQRRSYYLLSDRNFPKEYRQEAGKAYKQVFTEFDSTLFNDFCLRFANLLATKDEAFWLDYGESNSGLYDFLRPTRLIFEEYYQECGLPLPKWFPRSRYDDEQESGRDKWRKLYMAHPEWFIQSTQRDDRMFIDINKLNANIQSRYNQKTPADEYRNDLDSAVVIGGKDGLTIELDKPRFFKWLEISELKSTDEPNDQDPQPETTAPKKRHKLFGFFGPYTD